MLLVLFNGTNASVVERKSIELLGHEIETFRAGVVVLSLS